MGRAAAQRLGVKGRAFDVSNPSPSALLSSLESQLPMHGLSAAKRANGILNFFLSIGFWLRKFGGFRLTQAAVFV